jgi:LmbE family N-acetylglucosaminyl deacetylase
MAAHDRSAHTRADAFLAALADPGAPLSGAGVALVVAHADDETIGCGAQLPRLEGLTIVHVTDGAPRGGEDARANGFDTAQAYAAARRRELKAAVALAGVPDTALVAFDVPDQEASGCLAVIARRLALLYRERGIALVLTHAYEGGHPDHDATAFAVHAAARLLGPGGPAVIEMPFYNLGEGEGWSNQRFLPDGGPPETVVVLDDAQRRLKEAMAAAHASQARVLATFGTDVERFRPSPAHDFTVLPNDGRLLYEQFGWGMTGARWRSLALEALRELGLEDTL